MPEEMPSQIKSSMPLATQRIEAVISRFGKIQQSNYPPYARVQSVLFIWQNGSSTQEVWKTYPAEEAILLTVGQPVFLSSRTGRNNQVVWEVEFAALATSQPHQPPAQVQTYRTFKDCLTQSSVTPPAASLQNQDISTWVQTQAELYAQCFDAAKRTLAAREVSEETVRAAASTLFISASRKFHLDR